MSLQTRFFFNFKIFGRSQCHHLHPCSTAECRAGAFRGPLQTGAPLSKMIKLPSPLTRSPTWSPRFRLTLEAVGEECWRACDVLHNLLTLHISHMFVHVSLFNLRLYPFIQFVTKNHKIFHLIKQIFKHTFPSYPTLHRSVSTLGLYTGLHFTGRSSSTSGEKEHPL